jgi:DNA-binding MarR family transcriptional regulator
MGAKIPNTLYVAGPKLNRLNILNELAVNPHLTQAELARRSDLSIAMVNNYIKELALLGMVEYHRTSSKTVSYHVTPLGMQQANLSQHELLLEMVGFFSKAKEQIRETLLSQNKKIRRVILYGTGELAEMTFHAMESAGIAVIGICDENVVEKREFCGREVLNPAQIRYMAPDAVILVNQKSEDSETLQFLQQRGICILCLHQASSQEVNGNGQWAVACGQWSVAS